MMKHSIPLLVAMATLAGCQLYFGENDNGRGGGSWTYCGQDGYYECNDEDCYWSGPECPAGMTPGEQPGGFECKDSTDCAAGCYCGDGICEEAGFCTQDSDCGNGYTCNEMRASCEPIEPETSCVTDYDCAIGSYCNPDTLKCDATCTCASNAEAANQGYNYCDEDRTTCLPGIDPAGDCGGPVTCNLGRPSCPEGSVATISPFTSCYTGECQAINTCGMAPGCEAFTNESDCAGAGNCSLSYTGINCRNPNNNNAPCAAGSTSCVCDSYSFATCSDGS